MFGGGNFGNDASLDAFVQFLKQSRPDAEISCICVDPDLIRRRHQITTIPLSAPDPDNALYRLANRMTLKALGRLNNWGRAIEAVRQFDLLIVPGTSTLNDYGSGPFGTPYGLFRWAAAARLVDVKMCFVGTGAGPIASPVSRWLLRRVALWAHYLSFRDDVSKAFLSSLGVNTENRHVYPDLVFQLDCHDPAATHAATSQITVGVGLMNYNGWIVGHRPHSDQSIYHAYIDKMSRLVIALLKRSMNVRLLIGETVDRRAIADLTYRVKQQTDREKGITSQVSVGRLIADPINSLQDVISQVEQTDIVIATRFHNVVSALKLARPTISIGYEHKNDQVMKDFGLEEFCHSLEALDIELVERQLTKIVDEKLRFDDLLRQKLQETESRSRDHAREILAEIL